MVNSNTNTDTDVTKDWKTYTSTKYGITLKYPADWTVTEGAKTTPYKIDVYPETSDGWSTTSAITFWVASPYSVRCGEDLVTVTSNVTIGGMTAMMYSVTDKKVKSCVYKHYNLDISPVGWGENPEINVMADANGAYTTQDQILAALKLTDPTTGWKTYTNTKYGYSLKYPTNYKIVVQSTDENVYWTDSSDETVLVVKYRLDSVDGSLRTWFDTTPAGDITLDGRAGKKFEYKYCDGPSCGDDTVTYVVQHQSKLLGLELVGDKKISDTETQILSTFTFTK